MACVVSADVVHHETDGLVSEGVVPAPRLELGSGSEKGDMQQGWTVNHWFQSKYG